MNKLNSYFKAAAGLAAIVALVFVFGNKSNAGISLNDKNVTVSAEKGVSLAAIHSSKFESSARNACGAGKCGATDKKAAAKGAKKVTKEVKKEGKCGAGKCGAGKCGGADKKAEVKSKVKDAKNAAKEVKKEGKCGAGKCGK